MEIKSLGYVGVRARETGDWERFATKFLGMQLVDRTASTLSLRMDDRRQRVVVHADGGQGAAYLGWDVEDSSALDHLAARLEAAGVCVQRMPRALAGERCVKDGISFSDPGRQRDRGVLRPRACAGPVPARPGGFRFPHRPSRHGARGHNRGARRYGSGVLP